MKMPLILVLRRYHSGLPTHACHRSSSKSWFVTKISRNVSLASCQSSTISMRTAENGSKVFEKSEKSENRPSRWRRSSKSQRAQPAHRHCRQDPSSEIRFGFSRFRSVSTRASWIFVLCSKTLYLQCLHPKSSINPFRDSPIAIAAQPLSRSPSIRITEKRSGGGEHRPRKFSSMRDPRII